MTANHQSMMILPGTAPQQRPTTQEYNFQEQSFNHLVCLNPFAIVHVSSIHWEGLGILQTSWTHFACKTFEYNKAWPNYTKSQSTFFDQCIGLTLSQFLSRNPLNPPGLILHLQPSNITKLGQTIQSLNQQFLISALV